MYGYLKSVAKFINTLNELLGNKTTNSDYISGKCTYLGNWLTDISQLFAPEFYFDIQYNLPDKLIALADIVQSIHLRLKDNIQAKCPKPFVNKMIQSTEEFFNPLLLNLNKYKEVVKNNIIKPNPNNFRYDTRTLPNSSLNKYWLTAESIINILGYIKFCAVNKQAIPQDAYVQILKSFISENPNGNKPNYLFQLNQYYPSDHLDRAFLNPNSKKFKQQVIIESVNQQVYDKKIADAKESGDKNKLKDVLKNYKSFKANRHNFFDDELTENNKYIYNYLQLYKNVLGAKLNFLTNQFIKPYYLTKTKAINTIEHYIACARLGHTLHGIEDFFAHSNYIELLVNNLNDVVGEMDLADQDKFYKKGEFLKSFEKDLQAQNDRFDKSLFAA
jgi:hypothetical protein